MSHEAVLSLEYSSVGAANAVERSLSPEIGDIDDERSQVRMSRAGRQLELAVEASDVVALRASLNTWLSLVSVAEQTGGWV